MHFQGNFKPCFNQPENPGPLQNYLAPQIHSLKGQRVLRQLHELGMGVWPHASGETEISPMINSAKQASGIQQDTRGIPSHLGSLGNGLS